MYESYNTEAFEAIKKWERFPGFPLQQVLSMV